MCVGQIGTFQGMLLKGIGQRGTQNAPDNFATFEGRVGVIGQRSINVVGRLDLILHADFI